MRVNSGFTLIEMCLVLVIIAVLLLITPAMNKNQSILTFECERIAELFVQAKQNAIRTRSIVEVSVQNHQIHINDNVYTYSSSIACDTLFFRFNGKGNISQGNTLTCTYHNQVKEIVMNLGNGNIYVR